MKNILKDFNQDEVDFFIDYVTKLKAAKSLDKKTNQWVNKNEWAIKKTNVWFTDLFKKNSHTKLRFDGEHITISQNGLSYDYIAYKNRLLAAYPETKISFNEVYSGDDFSFSNNSDGVVFSHNIANPFSRNTANIIGAYCVIKNNRGEFITLLDKNEIEKHRMVAKTDAIWKAWYVEMVYKTIIKKATRIHYEDIYKAMNDEDNQEIEVEKLPEKRQDKVIEIKDLMKEWCNLSGADSDKFYIDVVAFYKVKAVTELNFEQQENALKMILLKIKKLEAKQNKEKEGNTNE